MGIAPLLQVTIGLRAVRLWAARFVPIRIGDALSVLRCT
jgi:hypothetical protein